MKNFYNEHKGYLKLKEELLPLGFAEDLADIVRDAIMYGIDKVAEKFVKKEG